MDHVDAAMRQPEPPGEVDRPEPDGFNVHDALRTACDQAHDVLGWRVVLLLLNDESAGLCCLVAAAGLSQEHKDLLIGAGLGASSEFGSWLERQPRMSRSYVLNKLGAGTRFSLGDITGEGPDLVHQEEQAVVVPLEVRGHALGALVAYDVGAAEYVSAQRVRVLELIGANAAALVDQALSESARRDLEALFALTQALAESDDLDGALERILSAGERMLRCQAAAVFLADEAAGTLTVRAQTGFPSGVDGLSMPISDGGPAALAVESRAAVHLAGQQAAGQTLRSASASALALPLRLGDELVGALLFEADSATNFGERERGLAPALAREAAVAIHRVQLFDRIALGKREWEATFDAMADGVFLINRDRRVVRANQTGAAMVGATPADLRGVPCCALFCDASGGCLTLDAVSEGVPVRTVSAVESGAPVSVAVSPIRNRAGETTGAVAVLRSGALATERDGSDLDSRVGRALADSPEAVILLDRSASVCWANPAAEALIGPSLGLLSGLSTLVAPRDGTRVQTAFVRALAGEAQSIDAVTTAEGREIVLAFSPALGAEATDEILVVVRDAGADRYQTHGVAPGERLRSLAALARDFAREGAEGLGRLDEHVGSEPRGAVSELLRQHASLLERIHALGRLRPDRPYEAMDLNRAIAKAVETTRPAWEGARERGVVYDVRFEPSSAPTIVGSASEIAGAFEDLIGNALAAQPTGGRIEIKVAERSNIAAVQVVDDGIGMSEEARQHCFDPFFTTRRDGSVGLGLASVHATVLRHGGRITVRSAPGEGSAFTIVLPLAAGDTEAPGGPAVYVIASSPLARVRAFTALEAAGVEPLAVETPEAAARAFSIRPPSLVVVDAAALAAFGGPLAFLLRSVAATATVAVVDAPAHADHATDLGDAAVWIDGRDFARLSDLARR